MADIEIERLIWIVTGVHLRAELGDRPLAYRVEQEVRAALEELIGAAPENQHPALAPAVISDVFYLGSEEVQARPAISIGGPGVNDVSAALTDILPTVVAIENTLVIQMDLDFHDKRVAVWGMNHLDTVRAVETFINKGYLRDFVRAVVDAEVV